MTHGIARKEHLGFTLIELLVVIAIIGLLSSIVLASLNAARTKGADAARISNVKSLETAMELYYNDNNAYPRYGSENIGYNVSNLASFLVPAYISTIPAVLVSDGDQYVWRSDSGFGLYIYTAVANSFCRTGVNINTAWWGSPPTCNF